MAIEHLSWFEAAILGVVQALTEFLPVSSSGHLVIAQKLLGIEADTDAMLEVAVHLGTLLSVLVIFRQDILSLLRGLLSPRNAPPSWRSEMTFLIIGTLPAGLLGITFKDELENAFGDLFGVGIALCFTGFALLSTLKLNPARKMLNHMDGLWIGFAQAIAILPGVSRSGSTITTALWLGIDRERAARLSFLLSIPVVAGASLLKAVELMNHPANTALYLPLFSGAITAFIVGLGALWLMLRWIVRPSFAYFGVYCLVVGLIATLSTL